MGDEFQLCRGIARRHCRSCDHAAPAIAALNGGGLGLCTMRRIHLEYRHAIVQIFTDALLAAQFQSRQLEPRLTAGATMAPRFLLTLNDLDEFGFRPGLDSNGYYRSNPRICALSAVREDSRRVWNKPSGTGTPMRRAPLRMTSATSWSLDTTATPIWPPCWRQPSRK